MNIQALAAEIVTKVRNSMQDSPTNQCAVVENLIREAIGSSEFDTKAIDWLEREVGLSLQSVSPPYRLLSGVERGPLGRTPLRIELKWAMKSSVPAAHLDSQQPP